MLRTLFLFSLVPLFQAIGECNLSTPPTSWLTTTGAGIMAWSYAGMNQTNNFCIEGNKQQETVEVDYHVNLPPSSVFTPIQRKNSNPNNGCNVEDSRIRYCFAFCGSDWETVVIQAALSSPKTQVVANTIVDKLALTGWATVVLQVDFENPAAHLNASVFMDPSVWCSVYIGIHPNSGFSYLYEIQLAKVIQ